MKKKKSYTKQTVPYAILLIVIIGVLVFFNLSQYKVYDYSYDEFIKKLIIHIPEKGFQQIRYYGFYSKKSKFHDKMIMAFML